MQPPSPIANEAERLAALQSYAILDTEADGAFDDLVQLAASVCGTPISAISLIDTHRQWFKASVGLDISEAPREVSFCGHAIQGSELMVVEDARADARFADNPAVISNPGVRFYAAAPLVTAGGHALGALCVVDQRTRTLTADQRAALAGLGRQCMRLLELRLTNKRLEDALGEREEAVRALKISEGRIHAVTEATLDPIVAADQYGTVLSWNTAAERTFGYPREEMIGRPLTTIMPEHYRAAHARGLARVATTGQSTLAGKTVDLQGLRKDGSTFDLEMSLGMWTSGEARYFSAVLRDMTASRQAATAVKNERDFTAAVLEATDALIIVVTPDGIITRFNAACERASGYDAASVLGRKVDFLIPTEHAAGVGEVLAQLAAGKAPGRYENSWLHRDGSKRLISWSNATLLGPSGAVAHIIGTGLDVTDQRRAETQLGRQSVIMSSVLEHMTDGVIVTDESGQFVLYNASAERMLGRGPTDGPPDTWPDSYGLFLSDGETRLPRHQMPMIRSMQGEHVEQFEIFARAPLFPEGRWHSVTSSAIRDAAQTIVGTISVGRDITDRKQAAELLAKQAIELRELALRDDLTGLCNRRGFILLAEQHLLQAARMRRPAVLMFLDLDGMKPINDRFGHEEGDRALRDTAAVLQNVFREADIVARLGGDEFVALICEAEATALVSIHDRIETALRLHNLRAQRPYRLAMSFGSTCYDPLAPRTLDVLLASADSAMYAEKQSRRAAGRGPAPGSAEHPNIALK